MARDFIQGDGSSSGQLLARPYTVKELSGLYGISNRVMLKWIAPFNEQIGRRNGWYYNVNQVKTIFNRLGVPHRVSDE